MKTDITKQIEQDLRYYNPTSFAGVRIDKFRDSHLAFEVPVEPGNIKAGLIDAVRLDEAFFNERVERFCRIKVDGLQPYYDLNKTLCQVSVEKMPECCDNISCRYNSYLKSADIGTLITCFEIKVTKNDFRSSHGHNFVGNANYYIVPTELYTEIRDEIPEGIGCISYSGSRSFRKVKECEYKVIDKDFEKSLLLSMLKKYSQIDLWCVKNNELQLKQLNKRFNEISLKNSNLDNLIYILSNERFSSDDLIKKLDEFNGDYRKFEKWLKSENISSKRKMEEPLDVKLHNEDWSVREDLARQGFKLDVLINDENWHVRLAVAEQGYGLDVLVNDENWKVRHAVAEHGYGLDVLINDENEWVRKTAIQMFKKHKGENF